MNGYALNKQRNAQGVIARNTVTKQSRGSPKTAPRTSIRGRHVALLLAMTVSSRHLARRGHTSLSANGFCIKLLVAIGESRLNLLPGFA